MAVREHRIDVRRERSTVLSLRMIATTITLQGSLPIPIRLPEKNHARVDDALRHSIRSTNALDCPKPNSGLSFETR
jgi:hypothetical protein